MSIGPGSRRKRPRNDLDDYLDEVESRLFCVTPADKRCLLRDLKAHVRELTTDEQSADRFAGRYQISMDQLREEIGEPDDIVSMYISSVKKKVPSLGLRLILFVMALVFIATIIMGLDRYGLGIIGELENSTWLITSGLGMIIGGVIALVSVSLVYFRFERSHKIIAYLVLLTGLLSYPLSMHLSGEITRSYHHSTRIVMDDWYSFIILIDVIVIVIIGLYIYLKHFKVMDPQNEVAL
jgi:hypothetical protein